MRGALLLLATLIGLGLLAPAAFAQSPAPSPPPLPTSIGPGMERPPSPPVLPGKKGNKGKHGSKDGKGGQKGGGGKGKSKKGKKGKGKQGSGLKASCGGFEHVQTYSGWGPALTYGRPVTVSYAATRCSRPRGRSLDLSVEGTATVHEVPLAGGALIETRDFSVTGTWRRPGNDQGWPPAWWSCGVRFADYSWQIDDVYTFHVSAEDGSWVLDVSTQGAAPRTVTWAYDAC